MNKKKLTSAYSRQVLGDTIETKLDLAGKEEVRLLLIRSASTGVLREDFRRRNRQPDLELWNALIVWYVRAGRRFVERKGSLKDQTAFER